MKNVTSAVPAFMTMLSVFLLVFLTGCGNGGSNPLVGTWQSVEYSSGGESIGVTATVEFNADGSAEARTGSFRNAGHYSVDGNTVSLTNEDGATITYVLQDNGQLEIEHPVFTIIFEKQ